MPGLVAHRSSAPGVFGNSSRCPGRGDGARGPAIRIERAIPAGEFGSNRRRPETARRCRAAPELQRLVESLDCPLVTTAAGKGVLPESHPSNFGCSLPYQPVQQMIADADVVLAVGTELAETDIYFSTKLPLGGLLIRIDV